MNSSNESRWQRAAYAAGMVAVATAALTAQGANRGPADHPAVQVGGKTYTPASILARNMGTDEDQTTAFTPHKVIGNVYYVGTRKLSSFLIVTPAGNILMDSTYERNVPVIQKSVEQLGFKFADTKILLGNHAHNDHMEGDASVKALTGAQVMAMAEDVPALQAMKVSGKDHPIDRILHDGDTVTLGGTTLTAHLTPGHTRGATTWTMKVTDGGKSYDVVFFSSLRAGGRVTPEIDQELKRSFALVRKLGCDVPLGDHPAQYNMDTKFARMTSSQSNPFIDRANCMEEVEIQEAMYRAVMKEQAAAEQK